MAGGPHPKGPPLHRPSSSASASCRKSRWESSANAAAPTTETTPAPSTTTITNNKNPPDPKSSKAKTGPSPKPSPAHPKHPPGPSPGTAPFPFPDPAAFGPPPPPVYDFHMLERRTFVLADGSVRSYFALPPDYQDFPPPMNPPRRFMPFGPGGSGGPGPDYWNSLGLDGRGPAEGPAKRKYSGEEEQRDKAEELAMRRLQLMQYGNPNGFSVGPGGGRPTSSPFRRETGGDEGRANKYMRVGGGGGGHESLGFRQGVGGGGENAGLKHLQVDQSALKKAFLNFVKLIHENTQQRKTYLEDGKHGRLHCLACVRSSKDFPDMHSLIMHSYNSDSADMRVDHLGLHKALCVLMGWDYLKPPDNSKAYQFLSAEAAAANVDDLIMWPPVVIIHNTVTGKSKDGRMEGLGNKAMDSTIRDSILTLDNYIGFGSGKSKSLYGRDGHLGMTLVKFSGDEVGLKDAIRMAEFFEKENHGRRGWARVQPPMLGSKDDEMNPNLVKFDEKTREKKRILYAYLGTAYDLDKVDFDTRKKVVIESLREHKSSK